VFCPEQLFGCVRRAAPHPARADRAGAARKLLEETVKLDNYEWKSEFAIVPDDIRDRVISCTDLDQLERWVQRAAVIATAQELLD
jgi:hypothetical protein